MSDEKIYDDEGFELDESGERALDNDGNPVLKPEPEPPAEPPAAPPAEPGETVEELKERLAAVERERDGVKHDLFTERDRRRAAEDMSRAGVQPAKMSREELEGYYEEPMTRGEFERERELLITEMARSNQPAQEAAARSRHNDYDEVSRLAEELLADPANEHLKTSLAYAADHGEAKYKIGKMHDKYLDRVKQEAIKNTVDNIRKSGEKPVPTAGVSGKTPKGDDITLQDTANMTPVQFAALPASTRERLMGGVGDED